MSKIIHWFFPVWLSSSFAIYGPSDFAFTLTFIIADQTVISHSHQAVAISYSPVTVQIKSLSGVNFTFVLRPVQITSKDQPIDTS